MPRRQVNTAFRVSQTPRPSHRRPVMVCPRCSCNLFCLLVCLFRLFCCQRQATGKRILLLLLFPCSQTQSILMHCMLPFAGLRSQPEGQATHRNTCAAHVAASTAASILCMAAHQTQHHGVWFSFTLTPLLTPSLTPAPTPFLTPLLAPLLTPFFTPTQREIAHPLLYSYATGYRSPVYLVLPNRLLFCDPLRWRTKRCCGTSRMLGTTTLTAS